MDSTNIHPKVSLEYGQIPLYIERFVSNTIAGVCTSIWLCIVTRGNLIVDNSRSSPFL
jgi:hypothetical protein